MLNLASRLMLSAFACPTLMLVGLYKFSIQYASGLAYAFKCGTGEFPWIECFVLNFRMVMTTIWRLSGVKSPLELAEFEYPLPSKFDADKVNMSRTLTKKLDKTEHCQSCGKKFNAKTLVFPIEYGLCRIETLFPREFLWIPRPKSTWGSPPDISNSKRTVVVVCEPACLLELAQTFSPALVRFRNALERKDVGTEENINWKVDSLFLSLMDIHSQELKDFVISKTSQLGMKNVYGSTHRELRGFSRVWVLDNVDLIPPKPMYKSRKECLFLIDTPSPSIDETLVQVFVKNFLTKLNATMVKSWQSNAIPADSPIGRYRAKVLQELENTPKEKMETVAETSLIYSAGEHVQDLAFALQDRNIPVTIQIQPIYKKLLGLGGMDFYTPGVRYCFRSSSMTIFPAPNKCFPYPMYKIGWTFELTPTTPTGLEELSNILMENDCLIMTNGMDLINKTAEGAFLYKDGSHFIGFILPDMFKFLMGSSTFQDICSNFYSKTMVEDENPSVFTKFNKTANRRPSKDAEVENVLKVVRAAAILHTFKHKPTVSVRNLKNCASVFFHLCLKTDLQENCNIVVRLGTLNQGPADAVVREFMFMIGGFDTDMKVRYLPLPGKKSPPRLDLNEPLTYAPGLDKLEFHLKVGLPEMWLQFEYIGNVVAFDGHFDLVKATFEVTEGPLDGDAKQYFFLITKDQPMRQWLRHLLNRNNFEEFVPRTTFISIPDDQDDPCDVLNEPIVIDESKSIFEIEEMLGEDISEGHFAVVVQNTFNFLDKVFDRKWFAPETNFASSFNRIIWCGVLEVGEIVSCGPTQTQLWLIGGQSQSVLDGLTLTGSAFSIITISDDRLRGMSEVASYRAIIAPVWSGKRFVDITQEVILRIARSDGKLEIHGQFSSHEPILLIPRYDTKLKSLFVSVLRNVTGSGDKTCKTKVPVRNEPCLFTQVKGICLSEPVFMLIRQTEPQDEDFAKYIQALDSSCSSVLHVMIPLNASLSEKAEAICFPTPTVNSQRRKRVRIDLKPLMGKLSFPYLIIGMDPNTNDSKENPIFRDDLFLVEIIDEEQLSLILTPLKTRRRLSQFCLDEKLTFVPKSALKPAPVVDDERILWMSDTDLPIVISHIAACAPVDELTILNFISWMVSPNQRIKIERPTTSDTPPIIEARDLVQFNVRFLKRIEGFSEIDSYQACLLTMKELTLVVGHVPLSLRYYPEERVPLKLEISIERTLKQIPTENRKKMSASQMGSKLVGNISIGYQGRVVLEFLASSFHNSISTDCFMNEEVSSDSENPTHELITTWTNPKALKRIAKERKSKVVPIELHLIRQTDDPKLTYFTNELECLSEENKSIPLLVIPRRSDFLSPSSSYSGSNPKLGGFLLEFDRSRNIFTGKFFPRRIIIDMMVKGGAEIYQDTSNDAETTYLDGSGSEEQSTAVQEIQELTETLLQQGREKRQAEEANATLIQSAHDLIQACLSHGPKLSAKKSLTRSQVTRIAPDVDVEKVLDYLGGLQNLSYHVKVRRDQLLNQGESKVYNLPSFRVDTRNEDKFQDTLNQLVEKAWTTMPEIPTFELNRCAFCRREDFEFLVCPSCLVTKYCNEQCFIKDKFTHMKECKDKSKNLSLELLSDVKKVFPSNIVR
ncbi:uncharacterized protein LOC131888669 [Tigriopus californicus]|uniref:uncharacterized protein LOC131888669 n=1 Tax=Tigriopus californicus TaxID=6832 RepID=UPI0027DA0A7A|nr:uncharacterized protein LOC131888669 [Tigriopus californicus]